MKNLKRKKQGFTLLELVIVVIIVAILASLALPKMFGMAETAKAVEGYRAIGTIREALERYYLRNDRTYVGGTMANLDINNPGDEAGSLFTYTISNQSPSAYRIRAARDSNPADYVQVDASATAITKTGGGIYKNVD